MTIKIVSDRTPEINAVMQGIEAIQAVHAEEGFEFDTIEIAQDFFPDVNNTAPQVEKLKAMAARVSDYADTAINSFFDFLEENSIPFEAEEVAEEFMEDSMVVHADGSAEYSFIYLEGISDLAEENPEGEVELDLDEVFKIVLNVNADGEPVDGSIFTPDAESANDD